MYIYIYIYIRISYFHGGVALEAPARPGGAGVPRPRMLFVFRLVVFFVSSLAKTSVHPNLPKHLLDAYGFNTLKGDLPQRNRGKKSVPPGGAGVPRGPHKNSTSSNTNSKHKHATTTNNNDNNHNDNNDNNSTNSK